MYALCAKNDVDHSCSVSYYKILLFGKKLNGVYQITPNLSISNNLPSIQNILSSNYCMLENVFQVKMSCMLSIYNTIPTYNDSRWLENNEGN